MSSIAQPVMEDASPALPLKRKKRRKKGKKITAVIHSDENTSLEGSLGAGKNVGEIVLPHSEISKEDGIGTTVGANPATIGLGSISFEESTRLEGNNEPDAAKKMSRRKKRKLKASMKDSASCNPVNILSATESTGPESTTIQSLPIASISDMEQTVVENNAVEVSLHQEKKKRKKPKVAKDSLGENTCLEGKTNGGENHLETILPKEEKGNVSRRCDSEVDADTDCQAMSLVRSTYEEGTVGNDQNGVEAILPSKERKHKRKKRKTVSLDVGTSPDPCDILLESKSLETIEEGTIGNDHNRAEELILPSKEGKTKQKKRETSTMDVSISSYPCDILLDSKSLPSLAETKKEGIIGNDQIRVEEAILPSKEWKTKWKKRETATIDVDTSSGPCDILLDCKSLSCVADTKQEGAIGNDPNRVEEASLPSKERKSKRKKRKSATMDVDTSSDPCDNLLDSKSSLSAAHTKEERTIGNNQNRVEQLVLPLKKRNPKQKPGETVTMDVGNSSDSCDILLDSKSLSCVADTKEKGTVGNDQDSVEKAILPSKERKSKRKKRETATMDVDTSSDPCDNSLDSKSSLSSADTKEEGSIGNEQNRVEEEVLPLKEKKRKRKKRETATMDVGISSDPGDVLFDNKSLSCVAGTKEEATIGNDPTRVEEVMLSSKERKPKRKKMKTGTMDVDTSSDPCDMPCVAETKAEGNIGNEQNRVEEAVLPLKERKPKRKKRETGTMDICAEEDIQVNSSDTGACSVVIGLSAVSEEKKMLKDSSPMNNMNVEIKNPVFSSGGMKSDPSHVTDIDPRAPSLPLTKVVESPRRKLLVLDLNGLLGDFVSSKPTGFKHDFKIKNKYVFRRPHCSSFLDFCFERFNVGLWSSRMPDNLKVAVNVFFGPRRKELLLFIWSRKQCTQTGRNTLEDNKKPLVLKELRKVWEEVKGDYNELNTVLLDDSPYKALMNPAYTAVFPEAYSCQNKETDDAIGPDGALRMYLDKLACSTDDVPKFIKENPFGQSPITESHPKWQPFYANLVDSLRREEK